MRAYRQCRPSSSGSIEDTLASCSGCCELSVQDMICFGVVGQSGGGLFHTQSSACYSRARHHWLTVCSPLGQAVLAVELIRGRVAASTIHHVDTTCYGGRSSVAMVVVAAAADSLLSSDLVISS